MQPPSFFGNFNYHAPLVAVAVQPDGKVIAVGRTHVVNGSFDFAIARYNSDGTLDSTFGSHAHEAIG